MNEEPKQLTASSKSKPNQRKNYLVNSFTRSKSRTTNDVTVYVNSEHSTVDEKEYHDSSFLPSSNNRRFLTQSWANEDGKRDIHFSLDESELLNPMTHNSTLDLSAGHTSFSKHSFHTDSSRDEMMSMDMMSVDSCSSYGGMSLIIGPNHTERILLEELKNKEFHPKIVEEMAKMDPSRSRVKSLSKYYTKLFSLMSLYGSEGRHVLDYPQKDSFLINGKLNDGLRLGRKEFISNILTIQSDYFLKSILSNFFFNIYEYVITPVRLLLILVQLFLMSPTLNTCRTERIIYERTQGKIIKEKIIQIVDIWVKTREEDFIYGKKELFEILVCFMKFIRTMKRSSTAGSAVIQKTLNKLEKGVIHLQMRKKNLRDGQQESPMKSISNCYEECSKVGDYMTKRFLQCDNQVLAKILFSLDLKIFLKLNKYVFFPKRFISRKNRSQNYQDYMTRFNTFLYWIIFMIFKMGNAPMRAKFIIKLLKLIQLMGYGGDFVNYEAVEHIKLALSSHLVKNLRGTRNILTNSLKEQDKACYDRLGIVGSANFSVAFMILKDIKKPCVPFLQKFVQFMASKDAVWRTYKKGDRSNSEDNKKRTRRKKKDRKTKKDKNEYYINFEKMVVLSDTINLLQRLQRLEASKNFLNLNKDLVHHDLYNFLSRDYRKVLYCVLGIGSFDTSAIEKALKRISKKLN